MRRITFTLLAGAMALLAASPARAAALTGNQLLKFCEDRRGGGRMFCTGFVLGVGQLMQHLTLRMPTMIDDDGDDGRDYLAWCPVPEMTTEQLTDLVVRELRDDPQHRHLEAYALVTVYLGTRFPCD